MSAAIAEALSQAAEERAQEKRVIWLASSKAFLTGWANVICYVRYTCFGTMQTGNGILFARALADERWEDAIFYALLMVAYIVGLCLYRTLDMWLGHRSSGSTVAPLYFLLLLGSDTSCFWLGSHRFEILLVAIAFGGMNAQAVQISPVVTHAITGNLNRLANALFDHYFEGNVDEAAWRTAVLSGWVSLTFLLGVLCCALLIQTSGCHRPGKGHLEGLPCSFVPVAVSQWIWLLLHDAAFAKSLNAKRRARKAAEIAELVRRTKAADPAAATLERRSRALVPSEIVRINSAPHMPLDLQEALLGTSPLANRWPS